MTARLNALIRRKFSRPQKIYAVLGDYNGNVQVPGYNYLHYARVQGVVQKIWNRVTSPTKNLEVEIEYTANQYRVVELRQRSLALTDHVLLAAGKHAPTHTWGATDPVFIYLSQLLNFRIYPTGLAIQIKQGALLGETWRAPSSLSKIDLSSYLPGSGACWVLVYVRVDGTFGLLASATADTLALLTVRTIPTPPFGAWGLAGVRMYAGQTSISRRSDILDLRWSATPYNASQGPSTATIADGEITAYSDTIALVGEGSAADDLDTINGGAQGSEVTLRASDTDTTITVKHGAGNIALPNDTDIDLDNSNKTITLMYDVSLAKWIVKSSGVPTSHTHIEADITDLDHNAVKIQGRAVAATAPGAGQAIVWNDGLSQWQPGSVSGGAGGGSGISLFWYVDGALAVADDVGMAWVAPTDCTINQVGLHVKETGSAGNTEIDILLNGTSIFGTQPIVAYDDSDGVDVVSSLDVDIVAGDVITMDITDAATGAVGASVTIGLTLPEPAETVPAALKVIMHRSFI